MSHGRHAARLTPSAASGRKSAGLLLLLLPLNSFLNFGWNPSPVSQKQPDPPALCCCCFYFSSKQIKTQERKPNRT